MRFDATHVFFGSLFASAFVLATGAAAQLVTPSAMAVAEALVAELPRKLVFVWTA